MILDRRGTTLRAPLNKQSVSRPVLLSLVTLLGIARAAEPPDAQPPRASRPQAVPELCVQLTSGPNPLDDAAVRAAIEQELGVKTTAAVTAESIGTVRVESGRGALVTIGYASADGNTRLQRRIALPVEPERRATVIAWIVGNLVRNEADEILLELLNRKAAQSRASETPGEMTDSASTAPTSPAAPPATTSPAATPASPARNLPTPPPTARATSQAREPRPESTHVPDLGPTHVVHAALFSPTLTAPLGASQRAFHLSFSAVYGHVGALQGFGLGLLVDRLEYRSRGVQLSGIWLDNGAHEGLLVAGVGTRGRSDLQGTELTGVAALRRGCLVGAQLAGVWASALGTCVAARGSSGVARRAGLQGLQLAGAGVYTGRDLEGAQIAGGAAISQGRTQGLQMAGAFAHSVSEMKGAQIAGGANVINGGLQGLQLSGGFNYLRQSGAGAQVTGAVNVAGDIDGLQLGVVNVARDVEGLQLGIVNVARRPRGLALGLFNWSEGARLQPILFFQNPGYLNAGYRTVSGHSTGTISFGYDPATERARTHFATGPRFAAGRFAFGAEFGYGWVLEHMKSNPSDRAHELDLTGIASVELVPRVLTVYGGGGIVLPVAGVVAIEPHGLAQAGVGLL